MTATTVFRDTTGRPWQADVSPAALARVAAACGQPLLAVGAMRIIREDGTNLTIDAEVLAMPRRTAAQRRRSRSCSKAKSGGFFIAFPSPSVRLKLNNHVDRKNQCPQKTGHLHLRNRRLP
jgi:hypothetical protein